MELKMAEETKLSPEGEALAEAFGGMLAGFAGGLITANVAPRHVIIAALGAAVRRVEGSRKSTASPELLKAVAEAVKRTSGI
jgi:hypothetical protein